jgi:hypothetical protein
MKKLKINKSIFKLKKLIKIIKIVETLKGENICKSIFENEKIKN